MTYSDKLRDPRWQKKRLEVLAKHNWECESCLEKEKTLHVHHGYYEKGLEPWEYPEESMHVVCEACHFMVQELMLNLHQDLGKLDLGSLREVGRFIRYLAYRSDKTNTLESEIRELDKQMANYPTE